MYSACPALKGRHGVGLGLILLLAVAPHVPVLCANPAALRNFSILAFDVAFIAPWLLAGWHRRRAGGGRIPSPAAPARGISLGAIALAGGGSFLACWMLGPTAPAELDAATNGLLCPLFDAVRGWSTGIAAIEHELAASGQPAEAVVVGTSLALLWIVPGVAIAVGFLCRWTARSAGQAAWQCACNRSRFNSTEVLGKAIDRGIIVLFVLNLPFAPVSGPGVDPAVAALAHQVTCLAVGARGGMLAMLGGTLLDWALAEAAVWRRHLADGHAVAAALRP